MILCSMTTLLIVVLAVGAFWLVRVLARVISVRRIVQTVDGAAEVSARAWVRPILSRQVIPGLILGASAILLVTRISVAGPVGSWPGAWAVTVSIYLVVLMGLVMFSVYAVIRDRERRREEARTIMERLRAKSDEVSVDDII